MGLMLAIDKLFLAGTGAAKLIVCRLDIDWHPLAFLGFQEHDLSLASTALLEVFRVGSGIKCHVTG